MASSKRRDGRVAEGARLESVYRGNSIQGSNPCLSAIQIQQLTRTAPLGRNTKACAFPAQGFPGLSPLNKFESGTHNVSGKSALRADRALYSSQHPIRSVDLEQRIRELCTKAIRTKEPKQFDQVMAELAVALRERTAQRKKVCDFRTRRSKRKLPSDKSLP